MKPIIAARANAILYRFLIEKCNPGDCFIIPSNICPEVVLTFLKAGVKVRFADIDPVHYCMNMEDTEKMLNEMKIAGILYNHTYGSRYTPVKEFENLRKKQPGLKLIDDKCLLEPEFIPGDNLFDLTLYSTNSRKQVDLGYGGYAFSDEDLSTNYLTDFNPAELRETESVIKDCTTSSNEWIRISELNWLNTEISNLSVDEYFTKIKNTLSAERQHREKIKTIYRSMLPDNIKMNEEFLQWRFNIWTSFKKKILDKLHREGLFAGGHYKSIGSRIEKRSFPVAEMLEASVINLFADKNYSEEQAFLTCKIILDILNK